MSSDSIPAPAFGSDPLSPISFLRRSAVVYGDHAAVIADRSVVTYAELHRRCRRLAGAVAASVSRKDSRVSILAPNTATMLECHFGVPMAGAVLNPLNIRLSPDELAWIVDHAGSELLIADAELVSLAEAVCDRIGDPPRMLVSGGPHDNYNAWLDEADEIDRHPADENELISINYTSGTTGRPKGAMYSHRGAMLQALAMAAQSGLTNSSVFLWTLPMFHCNGWCFPWALTAVGGTHVAMRRADPQSIWTAIREWGITHFNAAPTVLTALVDHPLARRTDPAVRVATGGAPPSPALLERLGELNIEVTHLYGLTETYGPAIICDWRDEWDALESAVQARLKARQGVANLVIRNVRVIDEFGADVPADGESIGEVVLRGNVVMSGYFRDPDATAAASVPGPDGTWFRTGDLGVLHPDGYLELRDRAKDVIISGGENIASIEVEQALATHPAVSECAVVAAPDPYWGEVPVAVVSVRAGSDVSEQELIDHVRIRLARFKAPKRVIFGELPKTGTGKIQKYMIRQRLLAGSEGGYGTLDA